MRYQIRHQGFARAKCSSGTDSRSLTKSSDATIPMPGKQPAKTFPLGGLLYDKSPSPISLYLEEEKRVFTNSAAADTGVRNYPRLDSSVFAPPPSKAWGLSAVAAGPTPETSALARIQRQTVPARIALEPGIGPQPLPGGRPKVFSMNSTGAPLSQCRAIPVSVRRDNGQLLRKAFDFATRRSTSLTRGASVSTHQGVQRIGQAQHRAVGIVQLFQPE